MKKCESVPIFNQMELILLLLVYCIIFSHRWSPVAVVGRLTNDSCYHVNVDQATTIQVDDTNTIGLLYNFARLHHE